MSALWIKYLVSTVNFDTVRNLLSDWMTCVQDLKWWEKANIQPNRPNIFLWYDLEDSMKKCSGIGWTPKNLVLGASAWKLLCVYHKKMLGLFGFVFRLLGLFSYCFRACLVTIWVFQFSVFSLFVFKYPKKKKTKNNYQICFVLFSFSV